MKVKYGWICSDTNDYPAPNMPIYLLVPEEFGGGYVEETNYKGDGKFGINDAFELVAIWNSKHLNIKNHPMFKPSVEDFPNTNEGRADFSAFQKAYRDKMKVIKSLKSEHLHQIIKTFGKESLRQAGIDIACYDEQNAKLPYPIKVTQYPESNYEAVSASHNYFYTEEGVII